MTSWIILINFIVPFVWNYIIFKYNNSHASMSRGDTFEKNNVTWFYVCGNIINYMCHHTEDFLYIQMQTFPANIMICWLEIHGEKDNIELIQISNKCFNQERQ